MNQTSRPTVNSITQSLLILAIGGMAAGGTWWIKGPPTRMLVCDRTTLKPGEICVQDIPRDRDIVWIDARSRADWQRDGLPASLLWNEDAQEDALAMEAAVAMKVMTRNYIVVYCYDGQCNTSHNIASKVRKLNDRAEVWALYGGWRALSEAGLIRHPNQTP